VETFAKVLLAVAAVLALVGGGLLLATKLGWSGRLPGTLVLRGESWTLYAPIGLSILISVVLTIVLNVFFRR